MEKRILLAIFLIALVLVLSNLFLAPPVPVDTTEEKIEKAGGPIEETEEASKKEPPKTSGDVVSLIPVESTGEDTVTIDTDLYRMEIATLGARLLSMELKGYESNIGEGGVRLIPVKEPEFLRMRVTLDRDTLDLSGLNFTSSRSRIDATSKKRTLVLTHPVGESDSISIQYTFSPDTYVIGIELYLPGLVGDREVYLQADILPRLMPTEVDSISNDINYFGTVMGGLKGDIIKVDIGDLGGDEGETAFREGPFLWAGVKNKYFIAALVTRAVPMKGVVSKGAKEENRIGMTAILPPGDVADRFEMQLYLGPQDYYGLSSLGVGMENLVEYGWWIIKPFTRLIVVILLWMHTYIENYGIVIILFSLMTKVVFFPLTQKSLKATQNLQKIQPLMKELQEKHKDDAQARSQEMMRLYKTHKVNPLGGCLPLLVQMPVLWALFYVFRMTIEFRGASFAFWIRDLSAPDSPPVLPIVMGLSMFLQQKLSPQSADPKMAPMMYIMPVVLTVVFISFPSGLVLYWTVNNLMAIAQQYLLNKKTGPPVPIKKETAPKPA
jgi:YidC/Oxa1 family membrane protein insertase